MRNSWRRSTTVSLAVLTASALTLAACGAEDDPDDNANSQESESPDPEESEPEEPDPMTLPGKGVTDTEIKVAYHLPLEPCGNDPATAGAYVVDPDVYGDRLNTLVTWFNENVEFPAGRQLSLEIVNDGGPNAGCEDIARAAAQQVANEMEAFAALGNSADFGGGSAFADTVTENGTVHIGGETFKTAEDLTSRAPYAWNIYQVAEASLDQLVWYIANREADTSYVANDGTESPRVWGALFYDTEVDRELSDAVVAGLAERGIEATQYFVSGDAAQAGQEATSLAAQMKDAGVNSVVYAAHGVPGTAVSQAFTGQEYFPDNFMSDYGGMTGLALFNSALYGEQANRFRGVGTPGPTALRIDLNPDFSSGPSADLTGTGDVHAVQAYQQAGGLEAAPHVGAPLGGFWAELATLAIGVVNAGDTLNEYTFAEGLTGASTCQIERFFGRDQSQNPAYGYSTEQPWLYHGYTSIYWTTEVGTIGSPGYFESQDGYTRYMTEDDLPDEPSFDTGVEGEFPLDSLDGPKGDPSVACS